MRSRDDLFMTLSAQAIKPVEAIVDKVIEYFSSQLPFVSPDGLVKLYRRADRIPNTFTKAQAKSAFNGLVLDDVFPAIGGRAVLLRAFRGCQPLLVKIPLNQTEARLSSMHSVSSARTIHQQPVFWDLSPGLSCNVREERLSWPLKCQSAPALWQPFLARRSWAWWTLPPGRWSPH